ncbi:ATP-binding protein [Kitasatospora sp. NPDC059408]|uniref:ATP-binding protein n=1 Tax=Kitasatospora sp. NPDC059408 TaxID=3346823 RepID=UPI0036C4838F
MPGMLEKPPAPATEYSYWLPRHRKSVAAARKLLRGFLAAQPSGELFVETGELVLSELVTNAVLHAMTPPGRLLYVHFSLHPDALRIEVHDAGAGRPYARPATVEDEAGRGLWLVSQLASRWGCCPRAGGVGKAIWATIGSGQ